MSQLPIQPGLFGDDEQFHKAWQEWDGMPEFTGEDLSPFASVLVHFATPDDLRAFADLVGQTIPLSTSKLMSIWYPMADVASFADLRYRSSR